MISLRTNVAALGVTRSLDVVGRAGARQLEQLSSGLRINRASDDAAGLVNSEALRAQANGAQVAGRNVQDGVSVLQTAEGALGEVTALLQRMRDLAVQAANTGAASLTARQATQAEFAALREEIDRIGDTTRFADRLLLAGRPTSVPGGRLVFHTEIGTNPDNAPTSVTVTSGTADSLVLTSPGTGPVLLQLAPRTYGPGDTQVLEQDLNAALVGTPLEDKLSFFVHNYPTSGQLHVHLAAHPANGLGSVTLADDGGDTLLDDLGLKPRTLAVPDPPAATTGNGPLPLDFQVGGAVGDRVRVEVARLADLVHAVSGSDLVADPEAALAAVDDALDHVGGERGKLGAAQNRLEHTWTRLQASVEDLSAAGSRVRDTDMASAMTAWSRTQVLQQAGQAMLAQANQLPGSVLSLLKAG